jgi:hypothetical protein
VEAVRARRRDPRPDLACVGLPPVGPHRPAGVPQKGEPTPSRHEIAIINRLGRRGAYIFLTQRSGKPPAYTYETGEAVLGKRGCDISEREFSHLENFLEPVTNGLFDFSRPQAWRARQLP